MEKMDKNMVLVFLDVSVNGDPSDRMIFELFTDVAPKTAENFRALCTGEKGVSRKTGKPLHYKGTFFHCIVKGHAAEAGDFLRRNGECGESIYSGKFPDESPNLSHDAAGLLSMAICDRDEKGSLFIVTFKADQRLDRKRVVFGKLVDGYEVLKKMEDAGDDKGTPAVTVKIVNSGEFHDGIDKKGEINLKMGKHAVEENNHSAKRQGKHKKSSRKKRKRRKYYTSESDSSSDTDTESSATDTDSESDAPFSLSDPSSSSDDRRKRRKRSRRDRHKHARKKDKRHEKRRRRREKKKRKSKRDKASDIENNKKSRSSSQDDVLVGALDVNSKHADERENENVGQKRSDAAYRFNKEDEFARENGHHQNNNKGVGIDFERSATRHPDIVDDVANKSRSGSLSPRRTKGQSMSMLPMPLTRKSPCVAPNRSPSPSISPSPRLVSQSKSMTPARSENSRSPVRSTREMSARMKSPARSRSIHSRSRSATYPPPRVSRSPPRASSKRSSLSRSLGKPSRRSLSRSPVRSVRKSLSRRSPSPSAFRRPRRAYRRSRSGSPVSARRVRSPVSDRGRSRSRTPSVDGSPKRVWRGRGFSDNKYGYVRRYRSRSPDRSPVRSYRYGGRGDRDRYRRSPRRYRSPPRARTPPRYRVGKRSRTRSRSPSRSPIRNRGRRSSMSRSPVRSRSPAKRTHSSSLGSFRRPHSLSPSRSPSRSPGSSPQSPQAPPIKSRSRSLSDGSPPSRNRTNLVSYGDGSPDSGRG